MNTKRIAVTAATIAGLGAASLAMAAPASASPLTVLVSPGQTQFQSYQRASQDAPCPHLPGETPWQSDWNAADYDWTPSYAQWPNGNTGGWVCNRMIEWAKPVWSTHSIV